MTNVDVSLITTNGSTVGKTCVRLKRGGSSPSSPRSKSLKGVARSVSGIRARPAVRVLVHFVQQTLYGSGRLFFCTVTVRLGPWCYYAPRERGGSTEG